MAKKKTRNKSAAIREYLAKNPDAGPKEVRTALAKRGIQVSEALVSNVKHRQAGGQTKPTKKAGKKKATKKKTAMKKTTEPKPLEDLRHAGNLMMEAVELVVKAGATEAKQLVNIAADMVKRIRE